MNNLRFNGSRGSIPEHWSETETKLRDFLRTTLNFGEEADQIDIDHVHRIKSNNSSTCTIIARFMRFKGCQAFLNRASNSKSDLNSGFSVRHSDKTYERMIEKRKRGHYASVRFDKLFTNVNILFT
jgi:hypothetical protein